MSEEATAEDTRVKVVFRINERTKEALNAALPKRWYPADLYEALAEEYLWYVAKLDTIDARTERHRSMREYMALGMKAVHGREFNGIGEGSVSVRPAR